MLYAGFDLEGDADTLSDEEVEHYQPQAAAFLQRASVGLDYFVTHANAHHQESDIWFLEDAEADSLASIYLKRARRVGWMAQAARQVEHLETVGEAGTVARIFGKRLMATAMFIPANGGFKLWLRD